MTTMINGNVLSLTLLHLRYASLFNSYVGLLSAAEDSRPLLLIGMGARGMGPLRAALEWTPVQAHATANPVTLVYAAQCQQGAAYIADWDQWREAGVGNLLLPLTLVPLLHSKLPALLSMYFCFFVISVGHSMPALLSA